MPTKIPKFLAVSLLTLSLAGGATLAYAWTEPTIVPPGANVDEPINTGDKGQIKTGDFTTLGLGTLYDLAVAGYTTLMGNVGIGTTDLRAQLHIGKQEAPASTPGSVNRMAIQPYGHTGGPWYFRARDTGSEAFLDFVYGNSATGLTQASSGNVGIGTTDPRSTKLKIVGPYEGINPESAGSQVEITGPKSAVIIGDGGTNKSYIQGYGSGHSNLLLNPNGGNVGIGTTDFTGITGSGNLKVASKIYGDGSGLTNVSASSVAWTAITGKPTEFAPSSGSSHYRSDSWVPAWSDVASKPTTISGFGIIDACRTDGTNCPSTAVEADGIIGNEVTGVTGTDTTLTRSGSGTGASPYTLKLNLGNTNSWTGAQTFGANTNFPSGIWNTSGNVGIGTTGPTERLDVVGNVRSTGSVNANGLREAYTGGGGMNANYFHSSLTASWFPYPGNNYNYIRGNTLIGNDTGMITTAGNVGIGILDPGLYKLNVAGNTNITGNLDITGDITGGVTTKGTFWDLISSSLTAGTITTTGDANIGGNNGNVLTKTSTGGVTNEGTSNCVAGSVLRWDGTKWICVLLLADSDKHYFVTNETYSGNLGGVSGANDKCNSSLSAQPGRVYSAQLNTSGNGWGVSGVTYFNSALGIGQIGAPYNNGVATNYFWTAGSESCYNWTNDNVLNRVTAGRASIQRFGSAIGTVSTVLGSAWCSDPYVLLCVEN